MNLINSMGLVLRRQRHLDNDTRLTLFLREQGKVLVSVKSGRQRTSKLSLLQEPFTKADYHVFLPPHGVYGRLIQGKLIDSHHGLRKNLQAFHFACRACEVVDLLFPFRAPSPEAFDILARSLQSLQRTDNVHVDWVLFIVRLLHVLGHGDHSADIIKLLAPQEQNAIMTRLHQNHSTLEVPFLFSETALSRCLGYIDRQLDFLLPQQLKSNLLSLQS